MNERKIRILIADDHVLFRRGVATAMNQEPDFEVVAEAGDGPAAVMLFETHLPDVALIDINMPGLNGLEVVKRLTASHADAHLIVLTTYDTHEDIDTALRAGAQGYLLKDATPEELAAAIRDVARGRKKVAPAIATKLADMYTRVHLTSRELEVLHRLAQGRSNKEISATLFISESTVKVHIKNLFEKLGASSRTEVIAAGIKRGLIRLPG